MTYDKDSFLAGLSVGMLLGREYHDKPKHYLTFESEDSSEFALYTGGKHWDGTLYYSTDAKTWTAWDGAGYLNSGGGVLYLRGSGNTVIAGYSAAQWQLYYNNVRCIGNIEYLLDWETVEAGQHPQMAPSCYSNMFSDCTKLTSAPELPATTLANECYYRMFAGCTKLTSAPELPATTLANECYGEMFSDCTKLTSAPELPATTLASLCYNRMFYNCASLTSAPELPATILAPGCYVNMFSNCASLTSAPGLPATTLANRCYYAMFSGCTELTSAPELPATTLANECYGYMFSGCQLIKLSTREDAIYEYPYRIPSSGTGTTASSALSYMFANTGGPFTGTPSINKIYYTDHPPVPAAQGGNS